MVYQPPAGLLFGPPWKFDDGNDSGPHAPAGNPLRAKRPAALRQRVLNSGLQRRPPPGGVAGCGDCLELVAEDLKNHDWYRGGCVNCLQEIAALGGAAWRRVVREPCPYCGRAVW